MLKIGNRFSLIIIGGPIMNSGTYELFILILFQKISNPNIFGLTFTSINKHISTKHPFYILIQIDDLHPTVAAS